METRFATLLVVLAASLPLFAHAAKPSRTKPPPPFVNRTEVCAFIDEMHAQHGFDITTLKRHFAEIRPNAAILRAIEPAAVPEQQRSWTRYRERFVNTRRISRGLRFWQENTGPLARAEALYGVPQEIIVAIIGVETEYGRNTGKFSVLEALSTLAFDYPPRADYFRRELEQLLLLSRENDFSPLAVKGSYAGAIGIAQFMPGSLRRYAVDFDGDKQIDLSRSTTDAIGSVARFLSMHGWQNGAPIAVPAIVDGAPEPLLAGGIKPTQSLAELTRQGVAVLAAESPPENIPAALIDLVSPEQTPEYWIGFNNFYVITRYNRSSFYAMSVHQLALALRSEKEALVEIAN